MGQESAKFHQRGVRRRKKGEDWKGFLETWMLSKGD